MHRWFWLLVAAATCFATAAADDLPRRGILGVKLIPAEGGGVAISEVFNPSLSDAAVGDVIVAVNDIAVANIGEIIAALGRPKPGDAVKLSLRRGGSEAAAAGTLIPAPDPMFDARKLELGHVTLAGGARIRTMLLRPAVETLTKDGRAPAVMMVPGINCGSGEVFANPTHPDTLLYAMLTGAGFAVYVVDKPGVGDSEGEPCATGGFDVEVEAFTKAAEALTTTAGIDPDRLFAIGLSMGGVQAPLIAEKVKFRGIVTWGTVVMPWYDYLLASFRRRTVLQGEDPIQAEVMLRMWRKVLAAAYVDGLSRAEIEQRMPEDLKAFEESAGSLDAFGGRSLKFAQQCDKANLHAAWRAFGGDLLSLHGEYDWVAEEYDHRLAAFIVNQSRPGAAAFEIVPGTDHGHTRHESLADSFANAFKGAPDDQFQKRVTAWLVEKAKL